VIHRIRTIDAHAAGEPLRLVVEGMPAPEGRTMLEKRAWAQKRLDHLRKALILEPRGHTDMYGALLTEPASRDSHAGILFMHNEGWSTMCGHGIIAVTTIAIERGLIWSNPKDATNGGKPTAVHIRYDTPAGPVQARAHLAHHGDAVRVESVAFRNVASFVFEPSLMVPVGGRKIPVDIAFGGAFYAIVDAEASGSCTRTTRGSKGSTERSSRRRRSCRTRTFATSRSSLMRRSTDRRAGREPPP
jgi:proline racemase